MNNSLGSLDLDLLGAKFTWSNRRSGGPSFKLSWTEVSSLLSEFKMLLIR